SGRRDAVVTGFPITDYDVDGRGERVVFSVQPIGAPSELWLAAIDRTTSPRQLAASGETSPHFGTHGEIIFRLSDGKANYIARLEDGDTTPLKISSEPISTLIGVSPDRKWVIAFAPDRRTPDGQMISLAVPIDGGVPVVVCDGFC